jgi:hypothetical protein
LDPDTTFAFKWVPVAGALGGAVSQLVELALAHSTSSEAMGRVGAAIANRWLFLLVWATCAAATALFVAILADLNRQNRRRLLTSGFAIGVVWPGAWGQIGDFGQSIVDAIQRTT